jgi:hypothetical protein
LPPHAPANAERHVKIGSAPSRAVFFNKSKDNVPEEIHRAGVSEWYRGLSEQDRLKLGRYLSGIEAHNPCTFFTSLISAADADENYKFAASLRDVARGSVDTDYERFMLGEALIDPLIGAGMIDEAKAMCMAGIDLYPMVSGRILEESGGMIPEHLECRNRIIDILVGIESDYDGANALLDRFLEMGMIDEEEYGLRKQSLKIHRLQRTFDCVYTVQPKG